MADEFDISTVDRLVAEIGRGPDALIPILRAIQDRFNYLPEAALRRICEITEITPASVYGVSTFYAQFRQRPAGRHAIQVCIGTACHVKGAETVFQAFRQHLGIPDGEDTDKDRLFTVEKVACLGCCMLAPAVRIDEVVYGFVSTAKVPRVLRDFLESCRRKPGENGPARKLGMAVGEVRLCTCTSCRAAGAVAVHEAFEQEAARIGVSVTVKEVGCTGVSYEAPLADIAFPDGTRFLYGRLAPQDVPAVVRRHFQPAGMGTRLRTAASALLEKLLTDEAWEPVTRYSVDLRDGLDAPFWRWQTRLATEYAGEANPTSLDDYLRNEGFAALTTCLQGQSPEQIVDTIRRSNLRGRGGAGFPSARKWENVRAAPARVKYIVCNGDEGDPGAFMDRMILESFPFRVIEGMIIGSYAVGAGEGLLYIRSEYPLAIQRVREALRLCEERGYLGENILGSGHSLRLRIVEGAGAFVCGEETALLAAVEGRRGTPRYRPPYPAEHGLWGKPTLINNVETFALVPWIFRHGAESFAAIGTDRSRGTKTFALAGKVNRGGLIEVAMGYTTLRQIVEDIGGGIQDGRKLKAVQVGGPSGGCVPAELADTAVDYEALTTAGTIMGSGGMVVLDDTDCMVDVARYFMTFTQQESCGKCTACRIGTKRMLEILERLCAGQGKQGDIEMLDSLAGTVQRLSLCGLGSTAPNPVVSTLRYFRDEYEAHIAGRCPAGKCKTLITYLITDDCIGCTRCAQHCPAEAIAFDPYEKHSIDAEKCTRCDTCRQVCPVDAIRID